MNIMQMASGFTSVLMLLNLLTRVDAKRLLLRGGLDALQDPELESSPSHDVALLASSPERTLGFPHPYTINHERTPTKHFHVGCIHDLQRSHRIYYHQNVPKEDQEKMTPDVCLNFCSKVNGTQFYGLHAGRECYCTPFFHKDNLRTSLARPKCDIPCQGDHSRMCGGQEMVSIWTVMDAKNTPKESEDIVGECGGAGVRHQICRSAANADKGCRYVYKAAIGICGVPNWGCYQADRLPQDCQDPSLSKSGLDEMGDFTSGVCATGNRDIGETKHLGPGYTPSQCRIACAADPLCTASEMPTSTLTDAEKKGWCALFYHSDSTAANDKFLCAHKKSRMTSFQTGVCGWEDEDMDQKGKRVSGGPYSPEECLQKCALDPTCHGVEQDRGLLASKGKSWCSLFSVETATGATPPRLLLHHVPDANGAEVAGRENEDFNCALKEFGALAVAPMTMAPFETGVCGRQTGRGGFQDTHHTVEDEAGEEGTHLEGTYTPEKCQRRCLEDEKCMGAEQPQKLNEHGEAWCALFYLTEKVTAIGLANNDGFKCALKSVPLRPQVW